MASDKVETITQTNKSGIPGMRGVEHIGINVPDLEEATRFFVDVLGAEVYYSLGPFKDEGSWMADNLDVHPRAEVPEIRIVRLKNGAHFELLSFIAPDQNKTMPRLSDYDGHHIAFYVDDMDAAVAYLKSKGIRMLGSVKDGMGPESGEGSTFFLFKSSWGATFELVSFPNGRSYEKDYKPMWIPNQES